MALTKGAIGGGGPQYFKPADHVGDVALIIEPRNIRKGVKTNFRDRDGGQVIRDEAVAFVTAFRSETSLEEGRPYFQQLVTFTNKKFVEDCERLLEQGKRDGDENPAAIVRLEQWQPKGGGNKVWIFKELTEGAAYDAAVAYYERREAELAKAIEEAPDFD